MPLFTNEPKIEGVSVKEDKSSVNIHVSESHVVVCYYFLFLFTSYILFIYFNSFVLIIIYFIAGIEVARSMEN